MDFIFARVYNWGYIDAKRITDSCMYRLVHRLLLCKEREQTGKFDALFDKDMKEG